jgi:hypothetical protein
MECFESNLHPPPAFQLQIITINSIMKSVAILAALAGSTTAFTPAATGKAVTSLKGSVFDDYVGAVDFRGKEFKWDPVSLY